MHTVLRVWEEWIIKRSEVGSQKSDKKYSPVFVTVDGAFYETFNNYSNGML